jgi:FkbM family methyltransferase
MVRLWLLPRVHASPQRRLGWWLRMVGKRLFPSGVYLGDGRVLTRIIFGETMLVDGRDLSVAPALIGHGVWEPDVTSVVLEQARPGMRALDIGANFGYYTLLLCRAVGDTGQVVAFEPQARLYTFLAHNIELNGYGGIATPYRLALGDNPGSRILTRARTSLGTAAGSGSLREAVVPEGWPAEGAGVLEQETVQVVRLDDLGLGRVDFAKIDAEGAELDIWRGGRRTLAEARCLVVEYVPRWLTEGPTLLAEMEESGFSLGVVRPDGRVATMGGSDVHTVAEGRGSVYVVASRRGGR